MFAGASKQHLVLATAFLVALCALVFPITTDDANGVEAASFVPRQIIVKLAPGVAIGDINSRYGTRVQERFLGRKNTTIFLLTIKDTSGVRAKLQEITGDTRVEYAEPNYLSEAPEADARHRAFPAGDATPTTKNYSRGDSYSDSALNLAEAGTISQGSGTRVAVLDTGTQLDHPALKARFAGVPRYDFVSDDNNPSEPPFAETDAQRAQEVVGHGTHVAGIVKLVAPKAELMPLRVLDREGYGSVFHIAEAVTFADVNGADVINLSLGTPSWSNLLREKVREAIGNGSVVVAATGNDDTVVQQYPASRPVPVAEPEDGLLAVTSVSPNRKKSDFANYGKWVDVAAPGEEILSTYPISEYTNGSKYAYWSGTSMASPFVAGEAALVHAKFATLAPAGVETHIRAGARCVDQDQDDPRLIAGGMLGSGLVNIWNSLKRPVEGQPCSLLPSL